MDVVGIPAHRQRIEAASAGLAIEQGGHLDGVGIEQVQDRAEDAREVDQPVLISPPGDLAFAVGAEQEVRGLPRLERRLGPIEHLILRGLDELDLLAGLLLKGRDDLPDCRVLLGVVALLPPDDEVGRPSAERGQDDRYGKNDGSSAHRGASPWASRTVGSFSGRGNRSRADALSV